MGLGSFVNKTMTTGYAASVRVSTAQKSVKDMEPEVKHEAGFVRVTTEELKRLRVSVYPYIM